MPIEILHVDPCLTVLFRGLNLYFEAIKEQNALKRLRAAQN